MTISEFIKILAKYDINSQITFELNGKDQEFISYQPESIVELIDFEQIIVKLMIK